MAHTRTRTSVRTRAHGRARTRVRTRVHNIALAHPSATHTPRALLALWFMPWALALMLVLQAATAHAQADAVVDPPGRVGRLAQVQGPVFWYDPDEGQWADANHNRPLTTGDRIATGTHGRAELRVGSSVLRLGPATELEVLRLDDEHMGWRLHNGSLALRLRNREAARETDIVAGDVRLQPDTAGHYRIDRVADAANPVTTAGAWRGSLRAQASPVPPALGAAVFIEVGQRVELWREWRDAQDNRRDGPRYAAEAAPLQQRTIRWVDDEFAAWAVAEDRQDETSTAHRYVSPEMTGAEDLDRHGRWEQHPEHGAMWIPTLTAADWAPYRHGRWAWVQPWGWTWVDDARWGFAPFHYGRWVNWRGRWGWCPGVYQARPVFAPALVAWVGGPRLNVSISIGLPAVAWVPLAPREVFVPHYRHTPVYRGRVNVHPPLPGQPQRRGPDGAVPGHQLGHQPGHQPGRPTGLVTYSNQGVPGAVTVVPRDVLLQRQPVARAVVDLRPPLPQHRPDGRGSAPPMPAPRAPVAAWEAVAPPAIERPQRPVFGRDDRDGGAGREGRQVRDDRDDSVNRGDRADRGDRSDRDGLNDRGPGWRGEPGRSGPGATVVTPPPQPQPRLQPQPQAPAVQAPVIQSPNSPAAPRMQPPEGEAAMSRPDRPRRDPRDADRRTGDMPAWPGGPQRPAAPAVAPAAQTAPAAPPAVVPAPAGARPPAAAPVTAPATAPAARPPVPAAPPSRAERPPEPAPAARPKADDKPARQTRAAEPEEGRKRGPGNRERERENLR